MVQQFREREVQPTGVVPGYQNVQYHPDAFGAGIGRALSQLGGTVSDLGKLQAQLEDQRRATDALDYVNKAKDEARPWWFDQNDGLYGKQGGAAMGATDQASAVLQDIQDRYLSEIDDPKTAEAFRKMWLRESAQVKDAMARHELQELGTYKVETSKAVLLSSMQDAYSYYNDEQAVAKALDDSLRAIDASSAGLPPEAIEAARSEARSQIHLAVISRWAQENPYKALEYYQANKDSMSGKDHVTATSLVEAARANRSAQEFVAQQRTTSVEADQWHNAIEWAESGGRSNITSPDGAVGPMQLHHMPSVREQLQALGRADLARLEDVTIRAELNKPINADLNRMVGRGMYNTELQYFNGDREAALVAYISGRNRAIAFLKHNAGKPAGQRDYNVPEMPWLKKEAEPYVKKIFARVGAGSLPPGTRMTRDNWSLQHFQPSDLMTVQSEGQWVDARAAQGLDDLAGWMKSQFPGIKVSVNAPHEHGQGTAGKRRGTRIASDLPRRKDGSLAGAGTGSRHLQGDAFDVQTQNWSDEQKAAFIVEARKRGFGGIGFYGPAGHLHIDMGNERTWGRTPSWAREALKTPRGKGPVAQHAGGGAASPSGGVPSSDLPTGQNSVLTAFGPTSPYDLDAALAQAQLIANPTERERTIALLRADHAEASNTFENERRQLQQAAWEIMQAGSVRDIPPEMELQLGPDFMSKLFAYEGTRAEGGPATNWQYYTDVTTGLTTEELARVDPYEARPHLADTEFKKYLELVRAARDEVAGQSTNSALLRNMRSRKDILDDIAAETGWDPKTQRGAKSFAAFNRKFGEYIEKEQQAKGSELTETELQDIADKLLLKGTVSGQLWGRSETMAFGSTSTFGSEISPVDPNDFIAASTWDQVQMDDQRQLITAYEGLWGNQPDQETAVDLYNRAMVVWLGGAADGPEEEQSALRTSIEEALGRALTPREMETYYARYLLKFLGR